MLLQERQQQLEKIASYQPEILRKATVKELRALAKGVVDRYASLKKPELVGELLRLSHDLRETKRLQEIAKAEQELTEAREKALKLDWSLLPDPTDDQVQTLAVMDRQDAEVVGIKTYKKLKDIVGLSRASGQSPSEAIGGLAASLVRSETLSYPNWTTRKSRRTIYLRIMAESWRQEKEFKNDLWYAFTAFKNILATAWADESFETKKNYQESVLEAKKDLEAIDPRNLLKEAKAVLTSPSSYKWQYVIKALAVATGRRPSELVVTASFKKVSEYEVEFKGLLKETRDIRTGNLTGKVDKAIIIPTLLPADLVVSGIEYLELIDRRMKWDISNYIDVCHKAHKKYSSLFSQMMAGSGMTLKDMRKVYAVSCKALFKPKNMADNSYYQSVLGHDLISSSDSYDKYYVADDVKDELRGLL